MPAPVLAAPLVIPFAEAIGVSIAALGMAKATDKVNEFIQENPEQSIKIFQMIMPSQGIANILKNESSEGDEEVSEDMDVEVKEKPKLTGKEKSEKIKAAIRRARAGKGNYSSPDAEGSAVDIRGSVIREVEDMGLADKDLKDKPYKEKGYDFRDYIPRGAYKKRYADGGSIGIEVLFEEKKPRKDFNIGGNVQSVTTPQPYDARATTQDFTNALDKVGTGTDLQKAVAIGEYGQNARRQNPFKNLGFLDTQRHFDNNQLLKNAVTRGELSRADYNRLGGFDVAQTMGAGNPVLGGIGNLIGSTGYNIVQSLKGNQSPFDIPGDVFRNVQGGTGLISDDLKTQYESIINSSTPTYDSRSAGAIITDGDSKYRINPDGSRSLIGKIGDAPIIDRPTMADVAGAAKTDPRAGIKEAFLNERLTTGPSQDQLFTSVVPDYDRYGTYTGEDQLLKDYAAAGRGTPSSQLVKLSEGHPYAVSGPGYYTYDGTSFSKTADLNMTPEYEKFIRSNYGLKEGGRVGLFMGGSPLDGQALAIYNSMNAYGFDDQAIADALAAQGLYTAPGSSTPETTTPNIINQQLQTGGGGGDNNFGGQGIGAFGNLDPNTLQTMQVEMADGMGGVTIKEVDTYLDAGGLRKTLDNKNPVNAGIDVKPMAITVMEALMGKKTDDEFDPAGKIYGTFNNPNYKDMSFLGKIKADYSRQKELKQLQKEFELQEKLKAQIEREKQQTDLQTIQQRVNQGDSYSDIGKDMYTGSGQAFEKQSGGVSGKGTKNERNYGGRKDGGLMYAEGGLVTMFKEKR